MTYSPRPYQLEAVDAVYDFWDEQDELDPADRRGAMLVLATGTGKTETALGIIVDFLELGHRVVFLAHREELLDQPAVRLARYWPHLADRVGIVQADRDGHAAQFVCASVATLRVEVRMEALLDHGHPGLIIVDEAHHSTSRTHREAIEALRGPDTVLLGLTATPDREDGADLSEHWEIVYSYSIVDAIRDGYLVPPYSVVRRLTGLDLSRLSGGRDYDAGELGAELLIAGIVDHTVQVMSETHLATRLPHRDETRYLSADGRGALVFTATVEQARLTALALCDAGLRARVISGRTGKRDRRQMLADFSSGDLDVLCNAAVLTEGTDLPIASVLVLARPTRSWSLYVQMMGRGLRLSDGKRDCLIIDIAGATEDHSLISAPVLIGGSRCKKSPNGTHSYDPVDGAVHGVCVYCGSRVACYLGLGPHAWHDADDGIRSCSMCGRPQCEGSSDGRHEWIPIEGHRRQCIDCGLEVPDPHAGMIGAKSRAETAEADWIRVLGVTPETWCVDVGDHGILYVVGSRETGTWTPIWLPRRARKPRRLTSAPVGRELVRAYADDIARKAERVSGSPGRPTPGQRRYADRLGISISSCPTVGDAQREISRARAKSRALAVGIVQVAES